MNIIIEHKSYKFDLTNILPKRLCKQTSNGWKTEYLGYCSYNGNITFILPKNFDQYEFLDFEKKPQVFTSFQLSWPIIIYKTLKKYARKNTNQTQLHLTNTNEITSSFNMKNEYSLIDTIFSLLNVHKNNPYIFFKEHQYSKKNKKKQSWKETIKKETPLIDKNQVFYPITISNDSTIKFDNLLLKIYYSTLNKISIDLNITIELNENIPILKNHQMKLLEKKVLKILKQIKGNYYSDLHKKIHYLLTLYYKALGVSSNKKLKDEFLLTSSFELIFEDMVDEVLSDKESIKLFKYHKDGKFLDHIYYDKSTLNGFQEYNSFYIGDSKYYSDVNDLYKSKKPIFKQYTYASNVLNQCINLEKEDSILRFLNKNKVLFWDSLNRSYHPITNFFILPHTEENDSLISIIEGEKGPSYNYSYHYKERAFDRNTHLILYFKINMHKLLHLYVTATNLDNERKLIRKLIRDNSIGLYKKLYSFKKIHSLKAKKIIDRDGLIFSHKYTSIICKSKK